MVERIVDPSFRMSDELFTRIEPLLPKFRKSKKGGRPRTSWRAVPDGIFYVLRTGSQWKALPPEFGSGSTAHAYFQTLVKRRTFTKLWKAATAGSSSVTYSSFESAFAREDSLRN